MGARIILVGLVAALGLTVPHSSTVLGWRASAYNWVQSRWEAAHASGSTDETTFVYVDHSLDEPTEPVAPYTAQADPLPQPAPVAAPAPASEAPAPFELDELALAGLDVPTEPSAIPSEDNPAAATHSPRAVVADADFDRIQRETVSAFLADLSPAPTPLAEPAPALAAVPDDAPAYEPIDMPETFAATLGDELNRENDGCIVPAEPAPVVAAAPETPTYEPIAVADDLYEGLAYELNREHDGTALADAEADATVVEHSSAAGESALTHAVRLTREAVYAWANLIHGPAVVTIDD